MLWADKLAVETDLHQELAKLRERELNFQIYNFNQLGIVSSVLIGAVSLVMQTQQHNREQNLILFGTFEVFAVLALGAFTTVNIGALLLTVLAPRLALHGPPGSVHRAVEELHHHRAVSGGFFVLGLCMFFVTIALHPWIYFPATVALPVSLAVAGSATILWLSARSIFHRLRLPPGTEVRGYFGVSAPRELKPRKTGPYYSAVRLLERFALCCLGPGVADYFSFDSPDAGAAAAAGASSTDAAASASPASPSMPGAERDAHGLIGRVQRRIYRRAQGGVGESGGARAPAEERQPTAAQARRQPGRLATGATVLRPFGVRSGWARHVDRVEGGAELSGGEGGPRLEEAGEQMAEAAPSDALAPPSVVGKGRSTSVDAMAAVSALEEEGRFVEAAELLAARLEELRAAVNSSAAAKASAAVTAAGAFSSPESAVQLSCARSGGAGGGDSGSACCSAVRTAAAAAFVTGQQTRTRFS